MAFNFFKKKNKEEKKKKTWWREWLDAIVFAVIAATLIRWLFFSAYTIPTPSMEGTQLTGDYLFVSKMSYGARTPKTILHLPLTDNTIWGTNIPSYLTWIQLPIGRLPGYSSVQNDDVVVFNFPQDSVHTPTDVKTNYIKRCIAVAGDKLEIRNTQVYINGKKAKNPPEMQLTYTVKATRNISRALERLEVSSGEIVQILPNNVYKVILNEEKARKLEKFPIVKSVKKSIFPKDSIIPSDEVYPKHPDFKWNRDNFGPLTVPAKDMTIKINKKNLVLYKMVIEEYDYNDEVEIDIEAETLEIDGKKIDEYTFKQDYFFMMGDNRHNSLDSRYWGFVPKSHVVGEAALTWLSLDPNKSWFSKIRWNRVFTWIR